MNLTANSVFNRYLDPIPTLGLESPVVAKAMPGKPRPARSCAGCRAWSPVGGNAQSSFSPSVTLPQRRRQSRKMWTCRMNFVEPLGKPFHWCLFDKARDEAHDKETRIAACGTNPGANFVVNLVVSFVALIDESETRSPDLPVAFPNGDASNGPLSSEATWRRFRAAGGSRPAGSLPPAGFRTFPFRMTGNWVYPEPAAVECLSQFAGEPGLA